MKNMPFHNRLIRIIITLLLIISSSHSAAKDSPKFSLIYKNGNNQTEQQLKAWLKKSPEMGMVASLINQEFKLNESLTLYFGGEDGPLFDSESNQILIPYAFLIDVKERFKKAKYTKDTGITSEAATMDALLHTIFHELAHAVIFQFELPVLGKEEDAADGLASVLLIEYFDEGQEVVISAADLFDLESQDVKEYQAEDYWGEHSLDLQRYYSSLCHVYGSAPEEYKHIQKNQKFSDEKSENCIDDYEVLVNSWMSLLEPFLRIEN